MSPAGLPGFPTPLWGLDPGLDPGSASVCIYGVVFLSFVLGFFVSVCFGCFLFGFLSVMICIGVVVVYRCHYWI